MAESQMANAFPTFQSEAQSSLASTSVPSGEGALGSAATVAGNAGGASGAGRAGMKQQIAVLEAVTAETTAGLRVATETSAADKAELTALIGAMETRLMGEIERLREETNAHFTALRAGIDATRKTLVVHKGEAAVHGEKIRAADARVGAMDNRLQQLVRELDGD